VTAPATSTLLLDSEGFQVGEFRCAPAHPLWRELNDNIGPRPHLVFPQTSVYIEQGASGRVLATPNHVVFYASHELYRRELHDPRGDVSLFVTVDPTLFETLAGNATRPLAASDAATYLSVQLLARRLRTEPRHDPLRVEETLHRLVRRAARQRALRRRPARQTTRRYHGELVEAAKDLIARRLTERLSLGGLARELHTSPFHLSRVFPQATGFTLHDYRIHLRLRRSLELLAEPDANLTRIAHELGFSSLGHFSGSFRAKFGVAPSAVRRPSAELSKILEARLAAAS
jgi:AraC-like DNA-binding protein